MVGRQYSPNFFSDPSGFPRRVFSGARIGISATLDYPSGLPETKFRKRKGPVFRIPAEASHRESLQERAFLLRGPLHRSLFFSLKSKRIKNAAYQQKANGEHCTSDAENIKSEADCRVPQLTILTNLNILLLRLLQQNLDWVLIQHLIYPETTHSVFMTGVL